MSQADNDDNGSIHTTKSDPVLFINSINHMVNFVCDTGDTANNSQSYSDIINHLLSQSGITHHSIIDKSTICHSGNPINHT